MKFVFVLSLATFIVAGINPWKYSPFTFEVKVPEIKDYEASSSSSWTGDFLWGLSYVLDWMKQLPTYVYTIFSMFGVNAGEFNPWPYAFFQLVSFSFFLYVLYFVTGRKTE